MKQKKSFALVSSPIEYELQKFLFAVFCEQERKAGFDVVIPPEERIAVQPPLSVAAAGNWGTSWHETKENAQWIKDNAKRKVAVFVLDTGAGFSNDRLDLAWWKGEERIFTGESRGVDTQSHSTHVSSSIGGVDPDKPIGVAEELVKMGLLKIIPYKVLNDRGSGQSSWIAKGIDTAVARAKELQAEGWFCIINMSLGGRGISQVMNDACDRADAAVGFVAAAAGNDNNAIGTPANSEGAFAVAAHDAGGKRAGFSNFGEDMEGAGAGVGILGLLPNNREALYSGTSMATPHVAGLVAIIASCLPWMDAEDIRELIGQRVHDIAPEGWDQYTGHGSFKLSKLIADPPKQSPDDPEEPEEPTDPEEPEEPEEPNEPEPPKITSEVRTVFGDDQAPLFFRYRRQSESKFQRIRIDDLICDIVHNGTEEQAFEVAKTTVLNYFYYTAMVIPDDPAFGYETTAWWVGQFLEYQARQRGVALQVISLKGTDERGRVALAEGFDRAGFRKTQGGAVLLQMKEH
jgi:hypothetical protein